MRLVIYTRVSSVKQVEEGVSLASQEARCRAWAALLGHEIVAVCQDPGVSGNVPPDERDGFKDAVELLTRKKAEGVLSAALDRLSRSVIDALSLVARFGKNEWALLSLKEALDTSTSIGRFTLTILAAVAELERNMIGERTHDALMQLKAEGRPYCNVLPWGKKTGPNGGWVENEVEVEVQDKVLGYLASGLSVPQMLPKMNAWRNHPRTAQPWTRSSLHVLLRALARNGKRKPRYRRKVA